MPADNDFSDNTIRRIKRSRPFKRRVEEIYRLGAGAQPGESGWEIVAFNAAHDRRVRDLVERVARGIAADDVDLLDQAFLEIDAAAEWLPAMRKIARLPTAASAKVREYFLSVWVRWGDHIRLGTGDDLLLARALRILLPPYSGPPMILYRGERAFNRRHRTYGFSWSAREEVADSYARGICRTSQGGSVVLRAEAPANAIICAPALLRHKYKGEEEYIVDRRCLARVTVLKRYSQSPVTRRSSRATLPTAGHAVD